MKIIIYSIFFIGFFTFGQTKYQKDFDYYWNTMDTYFAYFDSQRINWNQVRKLYQPRVDAVDNDVDFIKILEDTNKELHNGHVGLQTNLSSSHRLIPTGTDIWVSYTDHEFVISNLREGFSAEKNKIKRGMKITSFNDVLFEDLVTSYLPKSTKKHTTAMYEYVANMILAGTHDAERILYVNDSLTFNLDIVKKTSLDTFVETEICFGNIGYVKLNNSLGENDAITEFDKAIDAMKETKGIILDLRETPSGGNSTVARSIMGRFIDKEMPYQRHSFTYEEKLYGVKRNTIELVSPRGILYTKPLVVLCGRWTGSMGEGIVIGFEAMNRAEIVGTEMAKLLGAIYSYTMPETKIGFQIPVEKLFHMNGTPREDFKPKHYILDTKEQIKKAVQLINLTHE